MMRLMHSESKRNLARWHDESEQGVDHVRESTGNPLTRGQSMGRKETRESEMPTRVPSRNEADRKEPRESEVTPPQASGGK